MTNKNGKSSTVLPPYTFGIEVECHGVPAAVVAWDLRKAGIRVCDSLTSDNYDQDRTGDDRWTGYDSERWTIGSDGSVRGRFPLEIKSPILSGEKGLKTVRKVLGRLRKLGLAVNESCGLHVHVGAKITPTGSLSPRAVLEVLKSYHKHQAQIERLLTVGRRAGNNHFCQPVGPRVGEVEKLLMLCERSAMLPESTPDNWLSMTIGERAHWIRYGQGPFTWSTDRRYHAHPEPVNGEVKVELDNLATLAEHYDAVSLEALSKYGTIEFRQHHGSLNGPEVASWIRFVVNHVEQARKAAAGEVNRGRGRKPGIFHGLPTNVRGHFAKQARTFHVPSSWASH